MYVCVYFASTHEKQCAHGKQLIGIGFSHFTVWIVAESNTGFISGSRYFLPIEPSTQPQNVTFIKKNLRETVEALINSSLIA